MQAFILYYKEIFFLPAKFALKYFFKTWGLDQYFSMIIIFTWIGWILAEISFSQKNVLTITDTDNS